LAGYETEKSVFFIDDNFAINVSAQSRSCVK
jgi:hypothetical protein